MPNMMKCIKESQRKSKIGTDNPAVKKELDHNTILEQLDMECKY